MHRFFVSPQAIRDNRVVMRGTVVHQIRDVLRMNPGEEFVLLDNSGFAYRAEIVTIDRDVLRGRVVEKWKLETEPTTRITLYQGLLKGQKFDWVLQKGTEIGIAVFVPVLAARCIVGSLDDVSEARMERWQRIVVEAAEQAGRAALPHIGTAMLFANACDYAARGGLSLIPWEGRARRAVCAKRCRRSQVERDQLVHRTRRRICGRRNRDRRAITTSFRSRSVRAFCARRRRDSRQRRRFCTSWEIWGN